MDGEILDTIKSLSFESLCIAFVVFGLTMLVKLPIKCCTKKLVETKRKAINTTIVIIPVVLSVIISILYFGIFEATWFSVSVLETAFSAWVISLTLYAIYERVLFIVKGFLSGKSAQTSGQVEENLQFIKFQMKSKQRLSKKKLLPCLKSRNFWSQIQPM